MSMLNLVPRNTELNLRLKPYGCYSKTSKGVFLHMDHDFRVFVPNKILKKVMK